MRNGNVEKRDLALIDSIAEALEVFRVQFAAKSLSISVESDGSYDADIKIDDNVTYSMVSLSTKVFHYYERLGEWKDQTFEIIRTSSQADALMCLLEIYKAVGNGDNSNI